MAGYMMEPLAIVAIFSVAFSLGALVFGIFTTLRYLREKNASSWDEPTLRQMQGWYIELWDVDCGERYDAAFGGGLTLGRRMDGNRNRGFLAVGSDPTISREQCLLFTQGELLYLWNLSSVNPTRINGSVYPQPEQLYEGDRIAMGSRNYLVTSIVKM